MNASELMTTPAITVEPHAPVRRVASVTGGIVHFRGLVFSERERDASRIAAENIGGVRAVRDQRFRCQQVPSLE
jgi:osmotically-inducible protein OsmY